MVSLIKSSHIGYAWIVILGFHLIFHIIIFIASKMSSFIPLNERRFEYKGEKMGIRKIFDTKEFSQNGNVEPYTVRATS